MSNTITELACTQLREKERHSMRTEMNKISIKIIDKMDTIDKKIETIMINSTKNDVALRDLKETVRNHVADEMSVIKEIKDSIKDINKRLSDKIGKSFFIWIVATLLGIAGAIASVLYDKIDETSSLIPKVEYLEKQITEMKNDFYN